MRKLAAILAAVGLSATSALGATVTFAPNPAGSDTVLDTALPATVNFDLIIGDIPAINGANGGLLSVDVVVGSEGPLTLTGFTYNPAFVAGALLPPPAAAPLGIYGVDLYFGGAQIPATRPGGPSYTLGTLAVGVPAGTPMGDYTIKVDSLFDQFSSVNGTDNLGGVGTVHVVPEPATLGLLALGALGLIRRRLA